MHLSMLKWADAISVNVFDVLRYYDIRHKSMLRLMTKAIPDVWDIQEGT